ncbi:MAG: hypothetical protein ABI120_14380, partial [Gemmatimonadaceae bacterium]
DSRTPAGTDSVAAAATVSLEIGTDTAGRMLAIASAAAPYHVDDGVGAHGVINGDVISATALPVDTIVTPNRDSTGCKPFQDVTFPRDRTKNPRSATRDTSDFAVGNALVWLVGVTHGPRDSQPRRVNLTLDACHFEPRVLVASVGATLIVSHRDDMLTRLRFEDHGRTSAPRAIIGFTDPGQVVPNSDVLSKPGLVEVRDEKHSWVRGFIAVAPHPFVAVTESNGEFRFDGVPPGSYQLVVWHERLGARVIPVTVEQGHTIPVHIRY